MSRSFGVDSALLSLLPLAVSATSYSYTLQDVYAGDSFYSGFNFFTDADPTHGFVQYVDQPTANASGIIGYGQGTAKWGVDYTNVISNTSVGRQSIRLEGKTNYNHGLFLADIKHMPGSTCGVWPAFWTLGDATWPAHGEVDIVEGVNLQYSNQISAHTGDNCTMSYLGQSGTPYTNDCALGSGGSAGCGVGSNTANDYGSNFNANGGGVYAMQWTSDFIKVWFFARGNIPSSVTAGSPDVSTFGTPVVNFDGGSCNIDSHFVNHRMVFDTTFCGDWAGNAYSSTSCPLASSGWAGCVNYVANNPGDFSEAYWEVNSIKIFQESAVLSSSSTSLTMSSTLSSTSKSSAASSTLSSSVSPTSSTVSASSTVSSSSVSFTSSSSVSSSTRSSSVLSSTQTSSVSSSATRASSSTSTSSNSTPSSSVRSSSTSSSLVRTSMTTSSTVQTSSSSSSAHIASSSSSSSFRTTSSSSSVRTTSSSSSIHLSSSSSSSSVPKSTSTTLKTTTTSSSRPTTTSSILKTTTSSSGSRKTTSSSSSKLSTSSTQKTTLPTSVRTTSSSTKKSSSSSSKVTSTLSSTSSKKTSSTGSIKTTTLVNKQASVKATSFSTSSAKKTTSSSKVSSTLRTSTTRKLTTSTRTT